jgi:hypothetical protein
MSLPSRTRRIWLGLLGLGSLVGCEGESDRVSEVDTLRILAVRAETPFATPGSDVPLETLMVDGSPNATNDEGEARSVKQLWLGGCINPAGDSYLSCMPQLHHAVEELGDANLAQGQLPDDAAGLPVAWGDRYVAAVPSDIIESRPVAAGVVHPYGMEIVFVVVCAGELRRLDLDSKEFPLGCFDPDTNEPLTRDDFDIGFYPLFVYEDVTNQNPKVTKSTFDGQGVGPACDAQSPCESGSHCGEEGRCIPVVPRCTKSDKDDCPNYALSVSVPHSAVEPAVVAHVPEKDARTESLWVSYYSKAGSWEKDSRIISDPNSGWGEDQAGQWRANTEANTEVRLWAVVRDNRNGVTWLHHDVWVD